jgi:hypothetical protein
MREDPEDIPESSKRACLEGSESSKKLKTLSVKYPSGRDPKYTQEVPDHLYRPASFLLMKGIPEAASTTTVSPATGLPGKAAKLATSG